MLMSMRSCNRSFLGFFLDVCYAAFFTVNYLFLSGFRITHGYLDVGVLGFIV